MKTLTITEGRGRLGYWLKKAAQGEDVGFMFEGKIVALRPVEVVSTDYELQEYNLTPEEMAAAEKRIGAVLKAARKRGELTPFSGQEGTSIVRWRALATGWNYRRRIHFTRGYQRAA